MDKRVLENNRVRKAIAKAWISLLKEKSFSEIKVTDLVKKAGVARQSYYRNFQSMEDVAREYMLEIQHDTMRMLKRQKIDHYNEKFGAFIMEGLKQHKEDMLAMYHAGLSQIILELINQICELLFGNMSNHSIERYQLYCLAGMIFNVEMKWLENGAKESAEEISKIIFTYSTDAFIKQSSDNEEYPPYKAFY